MEASKRKTETATGDANKRQKLGFGRFANSTTLSDVTIRYGNKEELAFEAHKLLLSAKSYWFAAAFTGGFRERNAKEVALHGDEPDTVSAMLEYVYSGSFSLPEKRPSVTNSIFCIQLYRVADKYEIPELCKLVESRFEYELNGWLSETTRSAEAPEPISPKCFCKIVTSVYELSNATTEHVLVRKLLNQVRNAKAVKALRTDGQVSLLLEQACEEVSGFARDLCLYMLRKSTTHSFSNGVRRVIELNTTIKVKCPNCDRIWRRVDSCIESGHCYCCGDYVENWDGHDKI